MLKLSTGELKQPLLYQ